MKQKIINFIGILTLTMALASSGCTTTVVELPNGIKLSTTRKFDYTKIGEVTLNFHSPQTNFTITLSGYTSDRVSALTNAAPITEAVAKGVAEGLTKGMIPAP